jgi:hypothetical protein
MVLEALPDAIRLCRRILRPKRAGTHKAQQSAADAEGAGPGGAADILARRELKEEPATLWGRLVKARHEISMLLLDAATVC